MNPQAWELLGLKPCLDCSVLINVVNAIKAYDKTKNIDTLKHVLMPALMAYATCRGLDANKVPLRTITQDLKSYITKDLFKQACPNVQSIPTPSMTDVFASTTVDGVYNILAALPGIGGPLTSWWSGFGGGGSLHT